MSTRKRKAALTEEFSPSTWHPPGLMKTKTVSSFKVRKLSLEGDTNAVPPERILGYNVIPALACNTFICAAKNKGKTTLLYNVLKACANKRTFVYILAATHHKDPIYKAMKAMFDKRGIGYQCFEDIRELPVVLASLIKGEEEDNPENQKAQIEQQLLESCDTLGSRIGYDLLGIPPQFEQIPLAKLVDAPPKKPKEPKIISPDFFFILDDVSLELRRPEIEALTKIQKHLRSKVIISSQYIHDMRPGALMQLDYLIIFGGQNLEKLKHVFDRTDHHITFEKFLELYNDATKDKYGFLFYDRQKGKYRRAFSEEYVIPEADTNEQVSKK